MNLFNYLITTILKILNQTILKGKIWKKGLEPK